MTFTIEETVWITLPDGTRLAATVWMPEGAGPFPAVLEYLPYRRRDGTAVRDDSTYPGFAAQGIAGVRVDSRGQGDSEGLFDDEYSPTELADAEAVIAWIAARPWSNGNVGMMGISWGGFNGLQVAARRPPALKAVISIASTTDRYADDIHYKGGALLSANVYWAGTMLSYTSRPPDPAVVGNRWAEMWRARLDAMPMLLETWLTHAHRDAYWRHGSICEDWGAIDVPVWVIAGWGDGYRNTPWQLAANARHPVKAVAGPWVHKYPHFAYPHPRIDFIGMACDWWHHWLSDKACGVEAWPDHAVWRAENIAAGEWRDRDEGAWADVGAARGSMTLSLGADGTFGGPAGVVRIATPQHCGTAGGEYFTLAPGADLPADQRPDDRLSVCWEGEALDAPLDLIGRGVVHLPVSIDAPQGNLIARLVDVQPDGRSALIARGVLNLCHRNGSATPAPMVPGQIEEVTLELDAMAYRLRSGHRLRLALSTAYWPIVLPSPTAVTATLHPGARLVLPLAPDAVPRTLAEPAAPSPLPEYEEIEPGSEHRGVERDPVTGKVRYVIDMQGVVTVHPRNGMEAQDSRHEVWEIHPDDPNSCCGHIVYRTRRGRGGWQTSTETVLDFACHSDRYEVTAHLIACEGETEFHRRHWSFTVPRVLV